MNKNRIIEAIIERLNHDRQVLLQAAQTAHHAATDPENLPDNKYETLALESSYIAQGQANRAQEIKQALELYRNLTARSFSSDEQVFLTALVVIESCSGVRKTIFLGPAAGGSKIVMDGDEVIVITPDSPLGKDLIGKELGEVFEVKVEGLSIEYELIDLS